MSLLNLSNEIILEITSYFKYDGDISALMQTNSRLYHLVNTYRYRHNARHFEGYALEWAVDGNVGSAAQKALVAENVTQSGNQHDYFELFEWAIHHACDGVVKAFLESCTYKDLKEWIGGDKNKDEDGNDTNDI